MPVDETHMQEESASLPSPKRGYWAGWKTIKETNRSLWLFILLLSVNEIAVQSIKQLYLIPELKGFNLSSQSLLSGNILLFFNLIFIVALGTIADWLGIRRAMIVAVSGLLLLRSTLLACWLISDQELWMLSFETIYYLSIPFMALIVIVEKQAIRRYTTPRSRPQVLPIQYVIVAVLGAGGTVAIIPAISSATAICSVSAKLVVAILANAIVLILCYFYLRAELQLKVENGQRNAIPTTIAKSPFAGWIELLKNVDIHRAFLLTLITIPLGGYAIAGNTLLSQYSQTGEWLTDQQTGLILGIYGVGYIVALLFVPVMGKIDIGRMMRWSALLIIIGLLILFIPVGNSSSLNTKMIVGLGIVGSAHLLLSIRLFEYCISAVVPGREGSMASIVGVAWLASPVFHSILENSIENSQNEEWLQTLMHSIGGFGPPIHILWLFILIPALISAAIIWIFRSWFFDKPSWVKNSV